MADTPELTKKWWDKNKPTLLGATGMGDALQAWQVACSGAPTKLSTPKAFEAAFAACSALDKALTKLRSKAAKDKKVMGWCVWYEEQAGAYRTQLQKHYEAQVKRFTEDRQELIEVSSRSAKALAALAQEMAKLEKYLDETEDEAMKDVRDNGGLMLKRSYEQAVPVFKRCEAILREAKQRYETDGAYIKERRSGNYNAEKYGLMAAENERLAHLINEVVEYSGQGTSSLHEVQRLHAQATDSYNVIVEAYFGGRKSEEDLLKDLGKLTQACDEVIKQIEETAGSAASTVDSIASTAASAKQKKLTHVNKVGVPALLLKLNLSQEKVKRLLLQLGGVAGKGLKRLTPEQQKSPRFKPMVDRVKLKLIRAKSASDELAKQIEAARLDAQIVAEAPTVD